METINLNQLIAAEGGLYALGEVPFSGFAIETFPDGKLQTQMALMRGRQDGVTRRWYSNGQLESEKGFQNGLPHGQHREWRSDGALKAESTWKAGACIHSTQGDGVVAKPRSMASDARVAHCGYDFLGRQTYAQIEEVRNTPPEYPCVIMYADSEPQPPAGDAVHPER